MQDFSLRDAIYGQRQIAHYKTDPVAPELIDQVIDAAMRAPSGANRQPWAFIVVTDRGLIGRFAEWYKASALRYAGEPRPDEPAYHNAVRYLGTHMHEIPAMIFAAIDHSVADPKWAHGKAIVRGAYASSIFPAVQNLFLAARSMGLGTRLTTALGGKESEIKAALGIPDYVEIVCMIPIGYPQGHFTPSVRKPMTEVTHYNKW